MKGVVVGGIWGPIRHAKHFFLFLLMSITFTFFFLLYFGAFIFLSWGGHSVLMLGRRVATNSGSVLGIKSSSYGASDAFDGCVSVCIRTTLLTKSRNDRRRGRNRCVDNQCARERSASTFFIIFWEKSSACVLVQSAKTSIVYHNNKNQCVQNYVVPILVVFIFSRVQYAALSET